MKIYSLGLLSLVFFFLIGSIACSKDDDMDDKDDNNNNMETTLMKAKVDGQLISFDTLNASQAATLNLQGKPYNGFVPSIALAIKKEQTVGEHQFAVSGEVETAQYTGNINGGTHVFIAKSGSVIITEHRVNEYIKGTFSFVGEHTLGTLPDIEVTDGEFEASY